MEQPEPGARLSPRSQLTLQPDRTVLLQHRVTAEDDFAQAAQDVFALLKAAQSSHPGALRRLVLEVDGHDGERAGFEPDFFEFQQEFMLQALGPYFTWIEMPLTGMLGNPDKQQDAAHDRLRIQDPANGGD